MINILLAGGSGTRLWPISRTLMPKQFVKLFDDKSLFQLVVESNSRLCNGQLIVSNTEQYFLALDQLEEMSNKDTKVSFDSSSLKNNNSKYLLEPIGRNTAPAIALACMSLDPEELVLVTPSDHLIKNEEEYRKVVQQAEQLALENNLVTFGITPTYAETGFGYIESEVLNVGSSLSYDLDVLSFKEKPDISIVNQYIGENKSLEDESLTLKYYWNSGMFCFKAGIFLEELKKYTPSIYDTCKIALKNAININNSTFKIQHSLMENIPSESIDYAVMEKSNKVKVIPSDINWSDMGSFDALYEELPKDKNGNTINENHISCDSKNNLIYGNDRKIATIGIEDTIIVDTGDALLISKKGSSQKVKQIVSKIGQDTQLHNIHLTGHRPWGTYTILEDSVGYKIKRIEVKPHKRLSLQKHKHRNEHWIVVSGIATITLNGKIFTLYQNESTYIKAGDIHRLENKTNDLLIIIEAQVGSYTGEDDIERLKDDYKRD
ncbi:Mannose-1-phosphate guanylyltransferase (GDP) [hydrothermal vent metagenome]|uniref:mannose-1-phosphate guanylyltransferase n=1 Tax=hydrothermal vent metagenome TaxID=652676 RepID=A0A3B1E5G4_9ZZZZ